MGVSDYNTTPASNTAINGIDVQGTAPGSNFDNAIRQLMADAKVEYNVHRGATVETKTTNFTVDETDRGNFYFFNPTIASQSVAIDAWANLTGGWRIAIKNEGSYPVAVDPSGSETVNGAATVNIVPGELAVIVMGATGEFHCFSQKPAQFALATAGPQSFSYNVEATFTSLTVTNNIDGLSVNASTGVFTVGANAAGRFRFNLHVEAANPNVAVQGTVTTTGTVAVYKCHGGETATAQADSASRTVTHTFAATDTFYFTGRQLIGGGGTASLNLHVDIERV